MQACELHFRIMPPGLMAEVGWNGRKDKEFLGDAERAFKVFVTIERKIAFENDLPRF
jgi:hypothetical protein